jgi:hypothetical protein
MSMLFCSSLPNPAEWVTFCPLQSGELSGAKARRTGELTPVVSHTNPATSSAVITKGRNFIL